VCEAVPSTTWVKRHSRSSGADGRQRRHLALAEEDAEVGSAAGGAGQAGRGAGVRVLIFGARCAGGEGGRGRVGVGSAGQGKHLELPSALNQPGLHAWHSSSQRFKLSHSMIAGMTRDARARAVHAQ
jgi:hypothetical protein